MPAKQGSITSAPRTTVAGAASNLITVMVGVGILAFPKMFAKVGWCAAPPLLCAIAYMTAEVGALTDRSLNLVEGLALSTTYSFGVKASTFEDLGEACLGQSGKASVSFFTNSFIIFVSSAYLILIGTNMEVLSKGTLVALPTRAWVLVMTAVLAPTVLLKDISKISRFGFVGALSSVMYVVIIICAGLHAALFDEGSALPREYVSYTTDVSTLGQASSMMLFGFMYVFVVPTVRGNMAHPQAMHKAINFATYASVFVYMSCGMVGLYGWGVAVQDNVAESMAPIFAKTMSATVVMNLAVSYPILMHCAVVAMEALFKSGYWVSLRLSMVLVTAAISISCPYFMAVVGLGSSVLGIILGIFLPLFFFWRLCYLSLGHSWSACLEQESTVLLCKHVVIFFLGILTMFFGFSSSMAEFKEALASDSGNSFGDFWG